MHTSTTTTIPPTSIVLPIYNLVSGLPPKAPLHLTKGGWNTVCVVLEEMTKILDLYNNLQHHHTDIPELILRTRTFDGTEVDHESISIPLEHGKEEFILKLLAGFLENLDKKLFECVAEEDWQFLVAHDLAGQYS